jgi:hypothetical protein
MEVPTKVPEVMGRFRLRLRLRAADLQHNVKHRRVGGGGGGGGGGGEGEGGGDVRKDPCTGGHGTTGPTVVRWGGVWVTVR